MDPSEELTSIKGIGPGRAQQFARLGLFSLRDVLSFLPRTYLDYSEPKKIADIGDGESAAVRIGFIGPVRTIRTKTGLTVTSVSIGDDTANMTATWFNQPYIARSIPKEPGGFIVGCRLCRRGWRRFFPGCAGYRKARRATR